MTSKDFVGPSEPKIGDSLLYTEMDNSKSTVFYCSSRFSSLTNCCVVTVRKAGSYNGPIYTYPEYLARKEG